MIRSFAVALILGGLLTTPAFASNPGLGHHCQVPGTWFVNVSFPDAGFGFQQLLTLHRGGTLTETNNILHANSAPDPNGAPPPEPFLPLNGSDAHGSWKLLPGCRVQWSYLKLVFSGIAMQVPHLGPVPPGLPVGYLRVSNIAKINGDTYVTEVEHSSTEVLWGFDPKSPMQILPFGPSSGIGYRWLPSD
jgi:hypothetical protein